MREKYQKALTEIPLVPPPRPEPAFISKIQGLMKSVTLLIILDAVKYLIDMEMLQLIMDNIYQEEIDTINMTTIET